MGNVAVAVAKLLMSFSHGSSGVVFVLASEDTVRPPFAVTDLAGRIFSTWTLTTCMLCLVCARNPCNQAIYGELLPLLACSLAHAFPPHAKAFGVASTRPSFVTHAGATLLSFLIALLHFFMEVLIFGTMGWRTAIQPGVVASERRVSGLSSCGAASSGGRLL